MAPAMKCLPSLLLLAACVVPASSAQAAEPATPTDCITLSADQQVVRNRADRDVLLRNGDQHYRVVFTRTCSSAVTSRRLAFETQGQSNQLCGGSRSVLKTDRASCTVERIEPLEAATFQRMARQRSR